jgi:flagellar biosynthesis/type III secretory pathway chaperone
MSETGPSATSRAQAGQPEAVRPPEADLPPAVVPDSFHGLIALAEVFGRVVRAETRALKDGNRDLFETLTARKAEYHEALREGMGALEHQRNQAPVEVRERWRSVAGDCEKALQDNAKLIASEQLHAAAMLDMLRQTLRRQQMQSVGYGRDGRLRPRG